MPTHIPGGSDPEQGRAIVTIIAMSIGAVIVAIMTWLDYRKGKRKK
jgi:hypothetical protein